MAEAQAVAGDHFTSTASDPLSQFSLVGKTAFVTGASSGLGTHFAKVLASAGATVVVAARRHDRLAALAADISAASGTAIPVELDVTSTDSVARAFDTALSRTERIDILVNNAGVPSQSYFTNVSDDEWRNVMDVNLDGVFKVGREAAKRMQSDGAGGSIINIASILAFGVIKALSPYAASKAAVAHLTRAMAVELAREGIRVNTIAPGYFITEMNDAFLNGEGGKKLLSSVPMKRAGQLDELNGALLLLASDAGRFMTGSTVTVDGGHRLAFG
ncbi:MAG: glucose 1-dehydrogenase [Pseudomonadota bacterium]